MSLTLVDYLLTFNELKEQKHYSASVQATYLSVIMGFNSKGYPTELRMTVRELMEKSGLNSTSTAQECRRRLKNDGLIDFKKDRSGVSVYTLPAERYENNKRTRAERRANMRRTLLSEKDPRSVPVEREKQELERGARANGATDAWSEYADLSVECGGA